jgi:alpha-mannosidase
VQVEVPALGLVTIRPGAEAAATVEEFSGDEWTLENDRVRYVFSADGRLVEAFDKEAGRDILAEGEAGNVLSLYEDMPAQWEAWDVDVYYQDQVPATARVKEQPRVRRGPVRQEIEFALAIGQSRIHQKARLEAGSKRLDFVTEVDWCEQRRMLRTAFAVDVMSDRATFDIQYGYVQRPTHSNNSWDMAQFEVAGQRYADLSQGDYGAALLNDCKYGYKVRGNVLDLNLLRSPKYPDREGQGFTDQGVHRFTYSFLPHVGDLVESDVLAEAALMNRPVRVLEGKPGGRLALPCRIESDGVSLEVLKRAEKSDQWVVRLVETLGRRSSATLRLDESVRELVETDLLEWHDDQAVEVSGRAELTFEPFEIRTCKLR